LSRAAWTNFSAETIAILSGLLYIFMGHPIYIVHFITF